MMNKIVSLRITERVCTLRIIFHFTACGFSDSELQVDHWHWQLWKTGIETSGFLLSTNLASQTLQSVPVEN